MHQFKVFTIKASNMGKVLLIATFTITLASLAPTLNLASTLHARGTCNSSGHLHMKSDVTSFCSSKNKTHCCDPHKSYPKYLCSPPVTRDTQAIMTIKSFSKHRSHTNGKGNEYRRLPMKRNGSSQDGSRFNSVTMDSLDANRYKNINKNSDKKKSKLKCGNKYHNDKDFVVALSTGWYNGGNRCLKKIRIKGNNKSVVAKVVDECDSVNGCDSHSGFHVPCGNNIVVASPAVWKALGIPKSKFGNFKVTWTDV